MIPEASEKRTSDCLSEASKEPRRNWFERFLPRSSSNAVFIFTMTCYIFVLQYIDSKMVRLLGLLPTSNLPSITSTPIDPLLIAPLLESFVVIGLIELARWLRFNVAVQVAVPVLVSCVLESASKPLGGLLVAPIFLIQAAAYIYWRRVGFRLAAQTIILLHFFYNALVFIGVTAERLHR